MQVHYPICKALSNFVGGQVASPGTGEVQGWCAGVIFAPAHQRPLHTREMQAGLLLVQRGGGDTPEGVNCHRDCQTPPTRNPLARHPRQPHQPLNAPGYMIILLVVTPYNQLLPSTRYLFGNFYCCWNTILINLICQRCMWSQNLGIVLNKLRTFFPVPNIV